jgi:hypothetical protein
MEDIFWKDCILIFFHKKKSGIQKYYTPEISLLTPI